MCASGEKRRPFPGDRRIGRGTRNRSRKTFLGAVGVRRDCRQVQPARILSHYCPNKRGAFGTLEGLCTFRMKAIALGESSPEKAGVGSSIPSLATTISSL